MGGTSFLVYAAMIKKTTSDWDCVRKRAHEKEKGRGEEWERKCIHPGAVSTKETRATGGSDGSKM